ncbi:multiple epidermal growth factor-like domains protein 10 [Haliotis rufescens]|uniref:multiple epidermal growth factor-like domains protein 10 n=1 Tax=Haliotis rufescens TaxID=6454 RepID=UPI00201F7A36|nr:multiple epidermal growth factor-like domains protein 10 [Haliotis rufescens]
MWGYVGLSFILKCVQHGMGTWSGAGVHVGPRRQGHLPREHTVTCPYAVGVHSHLRTVNMAERFNCRLLLSCFVFILPGAECKVCPSECKDGLCQPNGLCDECRDGFYGIRCNKKCPPTCTDSLCYRFNVSCKKECSEGLYGKKCDKQCSRCPGSCHWRTGDCAGNSSARMHLSSIDHQSPVESEASEHSVPVCPSECKDGLCQPSGLCDDCRDGFYGIRCNKKCPPTCTDSLCYRFNVSCKKECSEGLYGKKCDKQCSRCPGSCHWRTGECEATHSLKQTNTATGETTQAALTINTSIRPGEVASSCRTGACRIDFNGRPVCQYGCEDGAHGAACDQRNPESCTQCKQFGNACDSNVSGLNEENCNKTCSDFTARCCTKSGMAEGLKIHSEEACTENCSMYCRNLPGLDTDSCDKLSRPRAYECIRGYMEALCNQICEQCKESLADAKPTTGGLLSTNTIIMMTAPCVFVAIVVILLAIRCRSVRAFYRSPAISPSLLSDRKVGDIVNVIADRDAGDGLGVTGNTGASLQLNSSYPSPVYHANRDTEEDDYTLPSDPRQMSVKHLLRSSFSYISPVHPPVDDVPAMPMDYLPRPADDNQTLSRDLCVKGILRSSASYITPVQGSVYTTVGDAQSRVGSARLPPQELYESLNRFHKIDPNHLYSFLESAEEDTNISNDTS